jgi:hypothetical protein
MRPVVGSFLPGTQTIVMHGRRLLAPQQGKQGRKQFHHVVPGWYKRYK